ncbi:MAG TPA: ADP-forming succinate--CoA ligase subunit beta [Gaiellales bacterium]|nr:ADP-forming succinate--CoA ligase subunit beta [Gaiellales bacterium]
MDLYEYQGKQLFSRFGIPVSDGQVVDTSEEAREAAERLGAPVMVKAQVLTGGRGKAGGIKGPASPEEAEAHARAILGMDINGHVARRVWIERASDIEREYYCSITFDRGAKQTLIMLTTAGGIEIEQVAHDSPEKIASLHVDPLTGFRPFHARRLCFAAGIPAEEMRQAADILSRAYRAYVETDAMLVEINPLIVTPDGELRALDSKYTVDDNALYKHPDIAAMRDLEALDVQERMARERGVTYVKLDGTVGIIGNGAGLVMSTLDVVAGAGGTPANFLDVGGGAQADEIVTAMEVLLSDEKVRAVLFNVFGGITRCDEVARGVLTALERLDVKVPMVVRLDGTNDVEGRAILAEAAPPNLHVAETMLGAAEQVVKLAGAS